MEDRSDSVAALLARVDAGDKNVRNRVARELGLLKDPADRAAIAAAIRSDLWQRRFAAVRAMRWWSPDELLAAGDLQHLLTDAAPSMRWAAVRVVAHADRLDVVGHLATDDPAPTVRQAAVLSFVPVPGADEVLAASLKDGDPRVRLAAVVSQRRRVAVEALDDLVPMLGDRFIWVRISTLWAVAEIGGQVVVPTIIPLLHDRKRPVRNAAAVALGKLGDSRAVDPLIGMLERATTPTMRSAALRALGRLEDRRAVRPAIAALSAVWVDDPRAPDGWFSVRAAATAALARLGGDDADRVIRLLPEDWVAWAETLS